MYNIIFYSQQIKYLKKNRYINETSFNLNKHRKRVQLRIFRPKLLKN